MVVMYPDLLKRWQISDGAIDGFFESCHGTRLEVQFIVKRYVAVPNQIPLGGPHQDQLLKQLVQGVLTDETPWWKSPFYDQRDAGLTFLILLAFSSPIFRQNF